MRPSVGSKGQSVGGTCAKKDLKTMLQLAHLYFTQPRRDTTAWQSLLSRTRSFLTNRNASPKVDYNDSINAILYGHHPRLEPVTHSESGPEARASRVSGWRARSGRRVLAITLFGTLGKALAAYVSAFVYKLEAIPSESVQLVSVPQRASLARGSVRFSTHLT